MVRHVRPKPPPTCRYCTTPTTATHHITAPAWRPSTVVPAWDGTRQTRPAFGAFTCTPHLDRAMKEVEGYPKRKVTLIPSATDTLF